MIRNLHTLARREHDLLVIGGGIFGACAAWEAASRGLTVALVERGDFSEATSSNYFRVAHGGIRYLQHADVRRVWESCRERSALIRVAPHLVYPLPILIPSFGHGMKGKTLLRAGFRVYDLLTLGRNRGLTGVGRRIPNSRAISAERLLELYPDLSDQGPTGGAVFYDGQIYSTPRLVISFLRAAADRGAVLANYVEAEELLRTGSQVVGAVARDRLSGQKIEIRASMTLNATGPWAAELIEKWLDLPPQQPRFAFSRDVALVTRRPAWSVGVAMPTRSKDADALVDRGGRHLFCLPWRGRTIIGVWHGVSSAPPDTVTVDESEIAAFLEEANRTFPGLSLSADEVTLVNAGLILFGSEEERQQSHSFGKRSLLIDHGRRDCVDGLFTLVGVRATMARGEAEKAIDRITVELGREQNSSATAYIPIFGGDFDNFDTLISEVSRISDRVPDEQVRLSLAHNYGSRYGDIIDCWADDHRLSELIPGTSVIRAEVVHAARYEMAQTLLDVVLRRTDLGNAGSPGETALRECAGLMADELHWTDEQTRVEFRQAVEFFRRKGTFREYGVDPRDRAQ